MLVREVITDAKTGEVTERWVESPATLTVEQGQVIAAADAQKETNARTMESQAESALASLRAYRDNAAPTNAQTVAVIKTLCRVCIAI